MKAMLVLVDLDNDFCEGGNLAVNGGNRTAIACAAYVKRARGFYDWIVESHDEHIDPGPHWSATPDFVDSWPEHNKKGTHGAEPHPSIVAVSDLIDEHFYKGNYAAAYSAFEGLSRSDETLEDFARKHGVTHIDFVGIAADYCVPASALDSAKLGFKTTVLAKLTVPVSEENMPAIYFQYSEAGVELDMIGEEKEEEN